MGLADLHPWRAIGLVAGLLVLVPACDRRASDPQEEGPRSTAPAATKAATPDDVEAPSDDTTKANPIEPVLEPAPEPVLEPVPVPFEPELALARALQVERVTKTDDPLGETLESAAHAAVFEVGGKRVGAAWFVVERGGQPLALLLLSEAQDELYEALFVRAVTFVPSKGAWTIAKSEAYRTAEGDEADYASLPSLLDLGEGRSGLLYAPSIQGCGAAPCDPADDHVTSSVHELAPQGLVERATFRGPGCQLGEQAPTMAGCTLHVDGASDDARGKLIFAARDNPSAELVTRTFAFTGDAYAVTE